jgi:hypothetical protein
VVLQLWRQVSSSVYVFSQMVVRLVLRLELRRELPLELRLA